jgi:toxin ParE1/3/4
VKRARFIAAARREFLAEVAYYSEVEPGLGQRFAEAVEEAAARALTFPQGGSPSTSNTRRVMVKRFPFSIFYRPDDTGIIIFAVAHHARQPG